MTTALEARIARVARGRGCSFNEAASVVAMAAARRRNRRKREAADRLTRVRSTWAWRRDFEL
jgi:hypothetical protein